MSLYKINQKIIQANRAKHNLFKYLDNILELLKKYYRGHDEINVSVVGGDGIVVNFNEGCSVAPISGIVHEIKTKGFFDQEDLFNHGI